MQLASDEDARGHTASKEVLDCERRVVGEL